MSSPYADAPVLQACKSGLLLSPMAGITDRFFRMICRRNGADLTFTEMVSVEGLCRGIERSFAYLEAEPEDTPLGVQLLGADPEALAEGARIVLQNVSPGLIDINMGCPVPKVTRSGAGSALMKDEALIRRALRALRKVVDRPLTIKIRAGWNDGNVNADRVLLIAAEEGVDAATIHTRTRAQKFTGEANWDLFWRLREISPIPLVANGDIRDARSWLTKTGGRSDLGIMIARGAIGNPYIFAEIKAAREGASWTPPTAKQRAEDMIWLAVSSVNAWGPRAIRRLRRVLLAWCGRLPGGKAIKPRVARVESLTELREILEPWVGH